jgi:poly-gamma-glutamate capsule biosynthesis protein CapA/YwtB (metallophosphatase superfamily)
MPRSPAPRHRRRSSAGLLVVQWLAVVVVVGLVAFGAVLAVNAAQGSGRRQGTTAAVRGDGAASTVGRAPGTTAGLPTQPAAVQATSTTAGPGPVTISVVGDTDLGNTPLLPPDPATYLDPVKSALAAQIVFGNLEGTLTNATASKCGAGSSECFAFRNPPQYAQYLRADGFTVLNSANNHSHDFGTQGVLDTSAALQEAGIVQAGLPGQIGIAHVGATSVAFVDFAPYTDTNNLLDLTGAKTLIQRARTEANIVVVYMHAGAEGSQADHVTGHEETYVGEDRGNPEAFAHAAIDDGADLVIASGPHVLRGMEFYRGHLIAYSLGNFAGYQNFATGGDLSLSGILKVTLHGDGRFQKATFTSTVLDAPGQPQLDPSGAAARFVAQLSTQDFGSAAAGVTPTGVISPPSLTS